MVTKIWRGSTQDPRLPILLPTGMSTIHYIDLPPEVWGSAMRSPLHLALTEVSRGVVLSPTARLVTAESTPMDRWVVHWPPSLADNVNAENEEPEPIVPTNVERPRSPLWRRHFFPILIATVSGVLLGILFMLVAIAAVLIGSWAYAITFGLAALGLAFGPVSLVVAYLRWDDRVSTTN